MSIQPGAIVRLKDGNPLDSVVAKVERIGARQTRVEFFRLPWTPPDCAMPEMRDFPHDQLIQCRDPWSDIEAARWSSPDACALKVRAAELWLSNAEGQLGSARTDLLPHQVCLVHEVVQRKQRRVLIAEEVGMGKTIETGMIIHALVQRRELTRCLVVCPAGQILQWQEELENKLQVRFEIYRHDVDGQRAFSFPRVIASLDTLKLNEPTLRLRGKSHFQILQEAPKWDMVVFDEAHRLTARDYGAKTEKTLNYRLAEALCDRTRDFLFLTGTPHDGNDSKFRNLIKALDPEVVFSRQETGTFFGDMIFKNRKSEARDAEGERLFKKVEVKKISLDPLEDGEEQFHAKISSYLKEGYGVAGSDPVNPRNRAIGFVMTTFQKLASSSAAAVRNALAKRLDLLEHPESQTPKAPPKTEMDSRFEGEAEEATAEALQAAELRNAFLQTEIKLLRQLVNFDVPREAKWVELCKLIETISDSEPNEKFLIFTEYRNTLAFLKDRLEDLHGNDCVGVIMGGMEADARQDEMRRFRESAECRFLISTEAGGEGINLQFCNIVINYDLPWNPFRVVQRIGRVHRIGQTRNMQVFSYRLRNELDERLADCHETRVESAVARLASVTGLDIMDIRDQLLGMTQEFIDYEKIYRQAISDSQTKSPEEEITAGVKRAEEAFQLAYETIFKHAISPFNPERFKKLVPHDLTLDDLHEWIDAYLKTQGRRLLYRENEDLYEFLVPESLKHLLPPDKRTAKGTFDRKRAIRETATPLFALGHPAIDLLLRACLAPSSDGAATFAEAPTTNPDLVASVTVLLRNEEHSGASAYRLIRIDCDGRFLCSYAPNSPASDLKGTEPHSREHDLNRIRAAVTEFLTEEFPQIDFIEEKLHWLAAALLVPVLSPEDLRFMSDSRIWIKAQLGTGLWGTLADVVSKRLLANPVLDLEDLESLAQSVNAKTSDVHAVLTSLSSRAKPLVQQEFYRSAQGQRLNIPVEEVTQRLSQSEASPDQWLEWAQQVGVAWKRSSQ